MTTVEALSRVISMKNSWDVTPLDEKALDKCIDLKLAMDRKFQKGDVVRHTLTDDSDPYTIEFITMDLDTLEVYYESEDRSYSYSSRELELYVPPKFEVKVKLFDSIDNMIYDEPLEVIKIPLKNVTSYEQANDYIMKSLFAVNKDVHAIPNFTYFIHVYSHCETIEPKPFIPHGRTFLSFEDAKKCINDYIEYIQNNPPRDSNEK